ncbi:hypothetical protein EMCRGX_G024502 [Ephydatia muelleri]
MKVTRNLKANMTSVRMTPVLLGDDTVDYESDSNTDFVDTDMNEDTTDDTYYPFPSKKFALLYMLVKGTQQVEVVKYLASHPLQDKADGKPVMLPLVLFADDTSGNHSKKWHKFESWYLKLATTRDRYQT